MMSIGPFQLILVLAFAILNIAAFWKLLPRAGVPSWVALISIFPLFSIFLFWVVAFKKWPGDKV
ncbi:MAG: LytS/YehU family sensor histidine kinase [Ascidiaceihabitans sp.]|mgnify:CR=1 FL=1|jgi:LytS/YehU family sensor histidine kinase